MLCPIGIQLFPDCANPICFRAPRCCSVNPVRRASVLLLDLWQVDCCYAWRRVVGEGWFTFRR